jgi:hypothetical protein
MEPGLKEFIDRAILPALLERFLKGHSEASVDAEPVGVLTSSVIDHLEKPTPNWRGEHP